MNDLISVVIPVYNVAKFLRKCLNSVLKQSYRNLEIILVDDGSTDGSSLICDEYQLKDPRFKVIHKKNEGLGLSRNAGLQQVHGKYVIFLDSDDYLGPNNIERLYSEVKTNNVDMVIGGYTKITNNFKVLYQKKERRKLYDGENEVKKVMTRMLGNLPKGKDAIKPSVWNNIYSMDIIKKEGLCFHSERELISEDIVWNMAYLTKVKKVSAIDSVDYFYRVNDQSLTRKFNPKGFELSTFFYSFMLDEISKLNLSQEAVLRMTKQYFIYVYVFISQLRYKGFKESYKVLKSYCENSTLQNAIKNYPINQLPLKQKMFLELLKKRYIYLLLILIKLK